MSSHNLDSVFLDNLQLVESAVEHAGASQANLPWADEQAARQALDELGFLADSRKVPAWYLLIDWKGQSPIPAAELVRLLEGFSALDGRGRELVLGVLERRARYLGTVQNTNAGRRKSVAADSA